MLFDSPHQEFVELPEIGTVPRFGCLTLWEHLAIEKRMDELRADMEDPIAAVALMPVINSFLAGVLLLSRKSTWPLEKLDQLKPETRQAIADFTLGERRRWQSLEPAQDAEDEGDRPQQTQTPDPIDWNQIFVRLASAMPGDPRWRADAFAQTPMAQIEGAIAALNQVELQRASRDAMPMALGFCYLLKAQGVKRIEVSDLEPYGKELKLQSEAAKIPREAAQLLRQLIKSGECPPWASNMIPPDVLERAAA